MSVHVIEPVNLTNPCAHAAQTTIRGTVHRDTANLVCDECVKTGNWWVHLRVCLTCGVVACCDSSPARHATDHFNKTGHPMCASVEPGENWAFCYIDKHFTDEAS